MSLCIQTEFIRQRNYIIDNAGLKTHISKKDGSPQTEIDIKVENAVLLSFRSKFPDVAIYGEESGYDSTMPEIFWLIDPIDGTASYMKNILSFTCMAVLVIDKQATASIIYNPTTQDMFTCIKNHGAYKNGVLLDLAKIPLPRIALSKGRYISTLNVD